MKNSQSNPANVVVTGETTTKQKAQSAAVTAVKVIVYPAHLVCQTAADILNIGQAQIINKIDGTPVIESMMAQQSWTQHKQAIVVEQGMKLKARVDARIETAKKQHAAKLQKELDKLNGVKTEPVVAKTEPVPMVVPVSPELTPGPVSAVVPAPPATVEEGPFVPINKRKKATQNTEVPLMSPQAVFAEPVLQ